MAEVASRADEPKKKNGLGDGANRRGTRVAGLQVGVGLLARLEQRETGHPVTITQFYFCIKNLLRRNPAVRCMRCLTNRRRRTIPLRSRLPFRFPGRKKNAPSYTVCCLNKYRSSENDQ